MATAEHRNRARALLTKAEEYLASAEDNLAAERHTSASGNAIHAGISAKDAIVTALTGTASKGTDHATAASELRIALGKRDKAAAAEKALRELSQPRAPSSTAPPWSPQPKPSHWSVVPGRWSSSLWRSFV